MKKYIIVRIIIIFLLVAVATAFIVTLTLGATNFTVSFDTNGGTPQPATQTIESGGVVIRPDDPQLEGFSFIGWYLDDELYDFSLEVRSDFTLVAHYLENFVTIRFDADNGSEPVELVVANGTILDVPVDPQKDGHIFLGWYLDGSLFDFDTPITTSITLVAIYSADQFAVTFNSAFGIVINPITVEYGQTISITAPIYEGYIVTGYTLNGEPFDLNSPIYEDIELTVVWTSAVSSKQGLLNNLNNASAGDQINISASFSIDEEIYILTDLTINGNNHQITYANALASLTIVNAQVLINDLTLSDATLVAVKVLDGADVSLTNVTIQNSLTTSVHIEYSTATLTDVTILGVTSGVINVVGGESVLTINEQFSYVNGYLPIVIVDIANSEDATVIAPMLQRYSAISTMGITQVWYVGPLLADLLGI